MEDDFIRKLDCGNNIRLKYIDISYQTMSVGIKYTL